LKQLIATACAWPEFSSAEDGMTIIVGDREIRFAHDVADFAVSMPDDRIVAPGPPKILFANPQDAMVHSGTWWQPNIFESGFRPPALPSDTGR
jgi:energy-coupling factor transporter ATP-binding protein EcfA2